MREKPKLQSWHSKVKIQHKIVLCTTPKLYVQHFFHGDFGGLFRVQIELLIAHWKACPVYFLNIPLGFNLELTEPLKIDSPKTASMLSTMVKKRAERSLFECFLTLWPTSFALKD